MAKAVIAHLIGGKIVKEHAHAHFCRGLAVYDCLVEKDCIVEKPKADAMAIRL